MLSVRTKRYQLPTQIFIKIGFATVIKRYWWAFLVPVAIILPGLYWTGALVWLIVGAVVLTLLYLLFWYIQFYGITQLPQGKPLFEKFAFQFENQHIKVLKNEKEGMVLAYDKIAAVEQREEALLLWVSRFQFFYLPHSIFTGPGDLRWVEAVLRRKKLLPEREGAVQ